MQRAVHPDAQDVDIIVNVTAISEPAGDVLTAAARRAGLNPAGAVLIRDGSNLMYRLAGGCVARIGAVGTEKAAEFQIEAARWLAGGGINAVAVLDDVAQPVVIHDRPVTWWRELPAHRPASTGELGGILRSLHRLEPPVRPALRIFDPFAGAADRIAAAQQLPDDDRSWLAHQVSVLREQLQQERTLRSPTVIHGDAWQNNVAVLAGGEPVLLDLEHVSLGDRDWDLIPLAADFARVSRSDYRSFVTAYGRDVTTAASFRTFADIQGLWWATFVLAKGATSVDAAREASRRITCLRGEISRPWTWSAF
ncbi:phosphotransferase family protein [Amycolatopsis nivea]